MKEVILQVRENEYEFLLKLLRQLNFVEIVEKPTSAPLSAEKVAVLKSIQIALQEVQLIQKGELPRKNLNEFLAELD